MLYLQLYWHECVWLLGGLLMLMSAMPLPVHAMDEAVERQVVVEPDDAAATFTNPIYEGADPWVTQHEGVYYTCLTDGNRGVAVYRSERLTERGEKRVVWRAAKNGPHSAEIWAPELHRFGDRWYIYVAASDGNNRNHRMIVLESRDDDPQSPFTFKAELYTGDHIASQRDNRWAIDGTPLRYNGRLYMIWSGWPDEEDIQYLYIAPMNNPWTIAGNRVKLCDNADHLWERVDESPHGRGLHEGPQVLQRNGRVFLIYSCSGSWQASYKLGMLELARDGDPMNPTDWTKHPVPVFAPTDTTFGTGHGSFVTSPDGSEDWLVYHAKLERTPGWRRAVHLQPFRWTEDGRPDFGSPHPAGVPLPLPAGEPARLLRKPRRVKKRRIKGGTPVVPSTGRGGIAIRPSNH